MISKLAESENAPGTLLRFAHVGMVVIAVATSIIAVLAEAIYLVEKRGLFADFTVFWTAARFHDVYNAEAITRAQLSILGNAPDLRPFAYPPSTLLLLKPLQLLDYSSAIILWTLGGMISFGAAVRLYGLRAQLGWLSPMVGLSLLIGQASLFTGGILAAGVGLIDKRPIVAGTLLGAIGAIKPQLAVLVPLALICGRHWRVLAASVAAGSAIILASLMLGPHLWLDWFQSLGRFWNEVQGERFRSPNIAPGIWFAPVGLIAIAYSWSHTAMPELRLLSLVGGTYLSVPYLMNYDLVGMAPAASLLLLNRDIRVWAIGFLAFANFWLSPFVAALGAVALNRSERRLRAA